jgi:hypothetical protein
LLHLPGVEAVISHGPHRAPREIGEFVTGDAAKVAGRVARVFPFVGIVARDDDAVAGPGADGRIMATKVAADAAVAVGEQDRRRCQCGGESGSTSPAGTP